MNIQAKKLEIVDLILKTEKFDLLDKVSKPLKHGATDWKEGLPEELIESVERGLQQAKNGNTISHETVVEKHKKWL